MNYLYLVMIAAILMLWGPDAFACNVVPVIDTTVINCMGCK